MVKVEIVTKSNEWEYKAFVDNCSCALVQHTMEWREVIAGIGEDIPVYLIARDNGKAVGALPAFLYKCELGNLIISIPQAGGYGGIVVGNDSSLKKEVYSSLLARLIIEAKRHDCLLVTVCTSPLFGEISLYRKYFKPDFEQENLFQYIDLSDDFVSDLDGKRRGKIRENIWRNIKKAKNYGLSVTREDSDKHFDRWYNIHEKRMGEIGAQPLPRILFEGIRRYVIKEGHGIFAYTFEQDRLIGGAVSVGHNQVMDYFMGSFDLDYHKSQPNSLLMYKMIKYAQAQGYIYWNWQSASSPQSGVYHYKAGWGSQDGRHYYLTKVVGDIAELRQVPLSVIKEKYRWHYVMPFQEFAMLHSKIDLEGTNE